MPNCVHCALPNQPAFHTLSQSPVTPGRQFSFACAEFLQLCRLHLCTGLAERQDLCLLWCNAPDIQFNILTQLCMQQPPSIPHVRFSCHTQTSLFSLTMHTHLHSVFKWANTFVLVWCATDEGSCIAAKTFGFPNYLWLVNSNRTICHVRIYLATKGLTVLVINILYYKLYEWQAVIRT